MKKRYTLKESQLNMLMKELENEIPKQINIDRPPIEKGIGDLPSLEKDDEILDINQPEYDDKTLQEKIEFLEDFFRDIVDFTEYFVYEVDEELGKLSNGEFDISRVRERLDKLTTRGGRKKFYAAHRGLR